jgi:hypothetical protein
VQRRKAFAMHAFNLYGAGFLTGPILSIFLLYFYWQRRGRMLQPLLFALTPLALASASIQLGVGTVTVVEGFGSIATQKATGIRALAAVFLDAQDAVLVGLLESAICVAVAVILAAVLRPRDTYPTLPSFSSAKVLDLACSGLAVFAVVLLVWYQRNTVDFCMVVVDQSRSSELAARFGNLNFENAATIITHRLTVVALTAKALTVALIAISFRSLNTYRSRKWDFATSMLFAVFALGCCGFAVTFELKSLRYLHGFAPAELSQLPSVVGEERYLDGS